ncbi:hypothetical protein AB838_08115 [Rhodobacteraceae bacterium (ex Bugula neritina AB1)]|nr:hypothetical protein AB838_08115 [Rhodobacteraceae bacterium (ex Bugula neritina AB1)]
MPHLPLARLHRLPELIIQNTKLWDLFDLPVFRRIEAGQPFPAVGVGVVGQPVPDQAPDVQLVVQDTGAALDVP